VPDLGDIGKAKEQAEIWAQSQVGSQYFKGVRLKKGSQGQEFLPRNTSPSLTIGNPVPSFQQGPDSRVGPFSLPLEAGTYGVTIDVLFDHDEAPYPLVRIRGRADSGLVADATASAISGTDWQMITVSFTLPRASVVDMFLEVPSKREDMLTWWDNFSVS